MLIVMVLILINKDVFEPSYNELKLVAITFVTSLILKRYLLFFRELGVG